jgi:outer membrane receptor protein involved in Fe transport
VSVFQNGVSIARSRGSVVQLFDLERVEVLKGPQGTLFGRSAQNGAVHIITNKPKYGETAGELSAEFGNFNQQAYEGFVNLPLIDDKLALRFAGTSERRDGFVNNNAGRDLNGKDSVSLRGSLRWDPTENLRIDFIGSYSEDSPPGTAFKSGVIPAVGGSTDPFRSASLNTFGNFLGGRPLGVDRRLNDATAIVEWQLSDTWRLTSTTAYREFDSVEVFDPDGSAFEIFAFAEDAEGEQRSTDLRFSFDNGGKLTGFFGGGVFKEKGRQDVPLGLNVGNVVALFQSLNATTDPQSGVAFFGGVPLFANALLSGNPTMLSDALMAAGIPPNAFQVESFGNGADNTSYDVFADVSYELTEQLTFTAGARYTRDEKESFFESALTQSSALTSLILAPPPLLPAGTPLALLVGNSAGRLSSDDFPVDDTFEGISFRGILNYEFADNKFVYLNVSRGRRPKVIQDDFATTPAGGISGGFSVIPAEIVDSYEIGTKGAYFDNVLSLDAAIYPQVLGVLRGVQHAIFRCRGTDHGGEGVLGAGDSRGLVRAAEFACRYRAQWWPLGDRRLCGEPPRRGVSDRCRQHRRRLRHSNFHPWCAALLWRCRQAAFLRRNKAHSTSFGYHARRDLFRRLPWPMIRKCVRNCGRRSRTT